MTTDVESSGCGSTNRNYGRNLPIREMGVSLMVVAPCLAHIFTIPFMLYRTRGTVASNYDPGPLTVGFDNDTLTNTTANIWYEDRDIFSTWPMENLLANYQKARECKLIFFISMGFGSIIAGCIRLLRTESDLQHHDSPDHCRWISGHPSSNSRGI